jgi:8-oxo-dGTP pyrophosphatase MutT (NUDIX family)
MAIRAVGAVALRKAADRRLEVLVIRKRGGMWTLPKGRVKRGEDDDAALLRELREETGLGGVVIEAVSQSDYHVLKAGRLKHKTVVYYIVQADPGEPRPGAQEGIEQACWMSIPRALKRIGRPRVRAVLRSALTMVAS